MSTIFNNMSNFSRTIATRQKKSKIYLFLPQKHIFSQLYRTRLWQTMIIMQCGRHVTDDINDQGTAPELLHVKIE